MVSVKYLLFYIVGDRYFGDLWKIISRGFKVYLKDDMERKGYFKFKKEM